MDIRVGDWVTSYSAGFWRVERIIKGAISVDASGKMSASNLVISKRFLSAGYRPLFGTECCSEACVSKLNSDELVNLESFLLENKGRYQKFLAREPKVVCSWCDVFFTPSKSEKQEKIAALFNMEEKIKASNLHSYVKNLGLEYFGKPAWRVEFKCTNYEMEGQELLYTFNKVHDF